MLEQDHQGRLRGAYASAPDCPSPEVFLQAAFEALPRAERQRIDEHASSCPRCAAERTLARDFDDAAHEDAGSRADVDFVMAKMSNPAGRGGAGTAIVHRFHGHRTRWFRFSPALAAAAVLALVMVGSISLWRTAAPALPEPPVAVDVRGNRLELVAPVGDVPGRPGSLQWAAVSGADRYRVRVYEVDRSVLLDMTTDGVALDLPREVASKLSAAVVYDWEVEALDGDGKRLAWSDATSFRVKPRAEER